MDRKNFERRCRLAALKFRTAETEADRRRARTTMVELKNAALELFGSEFLDDLHERYCSCIRRKC